MDYYPHGWADGRHEIRRRDLIRRPPFNIYDVQPDEFTWGVTIMMANGNESTLPGLFSRDWAQGFLYEEIAEATGLPIFESVQSYWTPIGRIHCTRAINLYLKPDGFEDFISVFLPILETGDYRHQNLPIILGRPLATFYWGPNWPLRIDLHPPLLQLNFSPPSSNTFPEPETHQPMAAATTGFHNTPPAWPASGYVPSRQLQVGFLQAGESTFVPAATAGDISSTEEETRLWVEENNNNPFSGDMDLNLSNSGWLV
ncbi:hypothetical protein B0I37DRAFT_418234 [Chaetomium sp. MPI-CAGE-AT-0009]|nr:hypothetical protein B0I37DRAFT_418234 [Chaetomium sp. MPI-CAGE-AT-0009]